MNGINKLYEFSSLRAVRTTNAARGRRKARTKQLLKAASPIRRRRGVKFRISLISLASIVLGRRTVRASFVFGAQEVLCRTIQKLATRPKEADYKSRA